MTFSLENPTGDIHVGLSAFETGTGSVNGLITAGPGQQSVTLVVPATATGALVLELATTEAVDFDVRMKLEMGPAPTTWEPPDESELARCQSHFAKTYSYDVEVGAVAASGGDQSCLIGRGHETGTAGQARVAAGVVWKYPVELRGLPTVTCYNPLTGVVGIRRVRSGAEANIPADPLFNGSRGILLRIDGSSSISVGDLYYYHAVADARPDMSAVSSSWVGLL